MVVPLPLWREDDISGLHVHPLSLDSSEATATFDDKAEGERPMTVSPGGLSRVNQL